MKSDSSKPLALLLLPSLRVGGAERQALEIARRLPAFGWRVRLLVCESSGPLREEIERDGLDWVDLDRRFALPKRSPAFWANVVRTLWRIRCESRRDSPAILQSFLFWENQLAAVAFGGPLLVQGRRDIGSYKDQRPIYQRFENWSNRLAARIVCNSAGVLADVRRRERVDPARVMVIPNGVDVARFSPTTEPSPLRGATGPLADARFVVGTVGNIKPAKRHDIFLETVARLASRVPGLRAVIVGDDRGGRRQEMEALAAKLGVGPLVHFAGRIEDVRPWLAAMDCFLLTSDSEGMPNVVLEAMASGLPVVTRPVEGIAELVTEGTGFVSRSGDPAELAELVGRVASAPPETRLAMGAAGRRRMTEHFSLEVMAGRYAALYDELTGRKP